LPSTYIKPVGTEIYSSIKYFCDFILNPELWVLLIYMYEKPAFLFFYVSNFLLEWDFLSDTKKWRNPQEKTDD
jgi:hypothetical protein